MGLSTKEVLMGLAIVAIGGGLLVNAGVVQLPNNMFSVGGNGDKNDDPNKASTETANVDQVGVDAKVSFPQAPSSGTVTLFKEKPEHYGNYVDFDLSTAKNGLSAGVDYREQSSITSDSVTFDDLASGTYYLVFTDSSYQTKFLKVTMPETVPKFYVSAGNDKPVKLASTGDFDLTATYGSDNIVVYDSDGNVLNTGTNIADPSSNGSRTVEIVRTIEVDTGVSYLGRYDITSFNDGDGIEDVSLTLEAAGKTCSVDLKNGNSGDLADSTSHGEDLHECISGISNVDTEPVKANNEITMTLDVTYTANTDGNSTAGDGELEPGESMLTEAIDDIFGNDVSTATKAITG